MDWPQYVAVGEIIRIGSEPEGLLDWRKAYVRFSGCCLFGNILNICQMRLVLRDGINLNIRSRPLVLWYHNFFDLYDILGFGIRNELRWGLNIFKSEAMLFPKHVRRLNTGFCGFWYFLFSFVKSQISPDGDGSRSEKRSAPTGFWVEIRHGPQGLKRLLECPWRYIAGWSSCGGAGTHRPPEQNRLALTAAGLKQSYWSFM